MVSSLHIINISTAFSFTFRFQSYYKVSLLAAKIRMESSLFCRNWPRITFSWALKYQQRPMKQAVLLSSSQTMCRHLLEKLRDWGYCNTPNDCTLENYSKNLVVMILDLEYFCPALGSATTLSKLIFFLLLSHLSIKQSNFLLLSVHGPVILGNRPSPFIFPQYLAQ